MNRLPREICEEVRRDWLPSLARLVQQTLDLWSCTFQRIPMCNAVIHSRRIVDSTGQSWQLSKFLHFGFGVQGRHEVFQIYFRHYKWSADNQPGTEWVCVGSNDGLL